LSHFLSQNNITTFFSPRHPLTWAETIFGRNQYFTIMPTFDEIAHVALRQKQQADYTLELNGCSLPFPTRGFVVIGGRPAMGKTTLMLQLLLHLSEKYGENMLVISSEHSVDQIYQRIIAIVTQTSIEHVHLLGTEPILAYPVLSNMNCSIEVTGHSWATAKKLIISSTAKFIFLDYLQLFLPHINGESRYEDNKKMLLELKALAEEHQKVIVIASQLSKKADKRTDKKPRISDLSKYAPLADIANVIALLYRPVYYGYTENEDGNDIRNSATLSVLKSTELQLPEIELEFHRRIPCFKGI